MKKTLIAGLFISILFLSGCNMNLSNLDVQKLNVKASEYMQAGEYDKAASRLESVIELNPNFPEAYYNLGIAYYNMSEYQKATEALGEAIIRNPEFADAYYSRAVVYEEMANAGSDEKEADGAEIKKAVSKEYLENAKSDYENYLKFKKEADDKDEVSQKIEQLDKEILEEAIEE